MLYDIKPTTDKFLSMFGLKAGVVMVLMDNRLAAHYRDHRPDEAPAAVGETIAADLKNARIEALKENTVYQYRYVTQMHNPRFHEASIAEREVDVSIFFGIGERGMLYMHILKARGNLDGIRGFPMNQNIYLIPVLNKLGEENAPVGSELKEGMAVWRSPSFDVFRSHWDGREIARYVVFDNEKSVVNLTVHDDEIVWVNEAPFLNRPIIVGQVYEWHDKEFDGITDLRGQPFTFSLRSTFGYNNNLWSWRSHGDAATIPSQLTHRDLRETYLQQMRDNNAEVVFPTEYYYDPHAKKLVPLNHTIV